MISFTNLIDLSKPLDEALETYSSGDYSDPELQVKPWCTLESQGYWVSQISLGTQTGTHIDAPAHFVEGGATLEILDPKHLFGSYFMIDLEERSPPPAPLQTYVGQQILFLRCRSNVAYIEQAFLSELANLHIPLWVISGDIIVSHSPPLYFHQYLARQGIFLVENLNQSAANKVPLAGTLIALPLPLRGVSGSPCRVIVISD